MNGKVNTGTLLFFSQEKINCVSVSLRDSKRVREQESLKGILSFYQKYDTDTLTDGGIIEISYDNGDSWINILDDNHHISINFTGLYEDTLQGGEYGFSGRSDDWQYVELYWHWIALVKKASFDMYDKILIRFRFISDDADTGKEGWMIDDMVFRGYDVVGSADYLSQKAIHIYPTPADNVLYFQIENEDPYGMTLEIYGLSGQLIDRRQLISRQADISGLTPGVYLYRLYRGNEALWSGRLVKK